MATMAAKVRSRGSEVVVIRGRVRQVIADSRLSSAIKKAFALYQQAKAVEPELSEARNFIAERARDFMGEGGTVSLQAGGITCTVTARYEAVIPEDNLKEVKRLLGRRFNELVRVRKKYLGSRLLIDEAASDERIRKLLTVRQLSPQFKWWCKCDS